jgi:hypothetical protein
MGIKNMSISIQKTAVILMIIACMLSVPTALGASTGSSRGATGGNGGNGGGYTVSDPAGSPSMAPTSGTRSISGTANSGRLLGGIEGLGGSSSRLG